MRRAEKEGKVQHILVAGGLLLATTVPCSADGSTDLTNCAMAGRGTGSAMSPDHAAAAAEFLVNGPCQVEAQAFMQECLTTPGARGEVASCKRGMIEMLSIELSTDLPGRWGPQ